MAKRESQTNVKYIFYKCTNNKRKETEAGNGSKDVQKMKGFERKEEIMTTNSKTVSNGKQGSKDTGFHNTLVYIRQHWLADIVTEGLKLIILLM